MVKGRVSPRTRNGVLWPGFAVSLLLHVAAGLAVLVVPQARPAMTERSVTVDLVALPGPAPAQSLYAALDSKTMPTQRSSGRPAVRSAAPAQRTPSLPPRPAARSEASGRSVPARQADEAQSDYQRRLDALAERAGERHVQGVLERLRHTGRPAAVTGPGGGAAGDYGAYLQSRLQAAFVNTIRLSQRAPATLLRLAINADGTVREIVVVRGSGDAVFDAGVIRAAQVLEKGVLPPPGGQPYQMLFLFRPDRVAAS